MAQRGARSAGTENTALGDGQQVEGAPRKRRRGDEIEEEDACEGVSMPVILPAVLSGSIPLPRSGVREWLQDAAVYYCKPPHVLKK